MTDVPKMQVHVKVDPADSTRRVEQVVHYFLPALDGAVEFLTVDVVSLNDPLDKRLFRCRVSLSPVHGEALEFEETQADLILAVTRVLDRTVRTIRRRQTVRQLARQA